jgi:hypothetical protein
LGWPTLALNPYFFNRQIISLQIMTSFIDHILECLKIPVKDDITKKKEHENAQKTQELC